jgi:hypothetical protein
MENPILGAKSAVLGFPRLGSFHGRTPQVEHLFKTGVPGGWGEIYAVALAGIFANTSPTLSRLTGLGK